MSFSERDTEHARDAVEETASLLVSHYSDEGDDIPNMTTPTLMYRIAAAESPNYTKTQFVILITLAIFIIDLAFCFIAAPRVAVFENIICHSFYKSNPTALTPDRPGWFTSRSNCTADAVQSELAILTQLKDTLDILPSLILAIPYGILAETFGRKSIMFMSMTGIAAEAIMDSLICWFPQIFRLRTIWMTPLLKVLGGGIAVTNSMLYTMLADFLEPADWANAFYLVSASSLLGGLTGNTLAATLMRISPWLPIMIGVGILTLSPLLILLFPETMKATPLHGATIPMPPDRNGTKGLGNRFQELWTSLNISTSVMFKSINVVLLISSFFILGIIDHSNSLQLQYVRKAFGWSYSHGALIVSSLPSGLDVIVFLILLPFLDKILIERMRARPSAKDLIIVRASAIILAFGSLLFALSSETILLVTSVSVITLGDGVEAAMRSLLTSLVPPQQISTVNSGLAVVSGAGEGIAGPILAMTFRTGMRAGGRWIALPFYIVAALCFLVFLVVCCVQLPNTDENGDGD